MSRYPHLFSPLQIGPVNVRNRIMQTAHVKLFTTNGVDSLRNVAYQVERAKGGAGPPDHGQPARPPDLDDGHAAVRLAVPEGARSAIDRRMTDGVHEHGAVIFAQLNHFGLNASSDSADDLRVLWGPSAVKSPAYGETPKAMEREDIAEVVEWWARSAELSREGGFDGTEVHISHSYLLHQFLSPLYNKRDGRVRRLAGEPAAVHARGDRRGAPPHRRRLGGGHPADADRLHPGGARRRGRDRDRARMLEARRQARLRQRQRAGLPQHLPRDRRRRTCRTATSSTCRAQVKATVGLPVFTIGGIKDPALAEEIVASGKADMVAMTRAQIADPEFANKAREGREDEIVHCIRGNQGCIGRVFRGLSINCTVNPAAGREARFGAGTLEPAEPPGRWLVVGGGPAGMRAA